MTSKSRTSDCDSRVIERRPRGELLLQLLLGGRNIRSHTTSSCALNS